MIQPNENLVDCYIQFKHVKTDKFNTLKFTDLINVFMNILEKEQIITIERK